MFLGTTNLGNRVRSKADWYLIYYSFYGSTFILKLIPRLRDTYREHAAKLRQTGGGIGGDKDESEETLRFYISGSGPDENTPTHAVNLWGNFRQFYYY